LRLERQAVHRAPAIVHGHDANDAQEARLGVDLHFRELRAADGGRVAVLLPAAVILGALAGCADRTALQLARRRPQLLLAGDQPPCATPTPRFTGPGWAPAFTLPAPAQPIFCAPMRRSSRRAGCGSFRSRSSSGSIPSRCASASMACSSPKAPCGCPGARNAADGPACRNTSDSSMCTTLSG